MPARPLGARGILGVWLYGTFVGELTRSPTIEQGVRLSFSDGAVQRWGIGSDVLSFSVPIGRRTSDAAVTAYFQGLLPEGPQLDAMAGAASVPKQDVFALLANYGRDVAGAVYVSDEAPGETGAASYTPLESHEFARHVAASAAPVGDHGAEGFEPLGNSRRRRFRSLGGYQGKFLAARFNGVWHIGEDGAPSTHIAKPDSLNINYLDLTRNEAAAMRLATKVGVATTETEYHDAGDAAYLVQSRYDRIITAQFQVARLHQEDATQALGYPPSMKYQLRGIGQPQGAGPTLKQLSAINPDQRADLLRQVTFRYLIGDTDAHAKNYSWLHLSDGSVQLASLYDCAPATHYVGNAFAQTINGKETFPTATINDVVAEAVSWGLPPAAAKSTVFGMIELMKQHFDDADIDSYEPAAWEIARKRLYDAEAEYISSQ